MRTLKKTDSGLGTGSTNRKPSEKHRHQQQQQQHESIQQEDFATSTTRSEFSTLPKAKPKAKGNFGKMYAAFCLLYIFNSIKPISHNFLKNVPILRFSGTCQSSKLC